RVRSLESARLSRFFAKDTNLPPELAKYFAAFDLVMSYLYDPDSIFEDNLRRSGARKIMWGPAKIANSSHAALQLAQPVEELGLPISDFAPRLYPSSEDRHRALEFVAGLAAPIVRFIPEAAATRRTGPYKAGLTLETTSSKISLARSRSFPVKPTNIKRGSSNRSGKVREFVS